MAVEHPQGRIPRPIGPTPQEVQEVNRRRGKKSMVSRLAGSTSAKLAAAIVILGGGYEAYHDVPAIHEELDSLYNKTLQQLGIETVVPQEFNNKTSEGVIGKNNIHIISRQEAMTANLKPVAADNSLTFLFPIQLPEGGARVQYIRHLTGYTFAEPQAVPTQDRQRQEEAIAQQEELKQKGIKDSIDFVLPIDSIIIAPVDGHILITKSQQNSNEDPNRAQFARFFFYQPETDITYALWFSDLDASPISAPFYSFNLVQDDTPDLWRGTSWENLPVIQQGMPMLRTTKDGQRVELNIKAYKGKVVGPQAEIIYKTASPITPDFLTVTDPASGKQKLVALE